MLYRISYFIFCIFISCLIVFTIHKGFQKQDIITIPIFGILLFLIIDFSAKSMYQNKLENFLNNQFSSQLTEQFTQEEEESKKNAVYKFRTARAGHGMASGTLVNSGVKKDASEKESISKVLCPPKDGKKGFWVCNEVKYNDGRKRTGCGCVYDTEPKDKLNLFNKMSEEESKKNPIYKFRTARAGHGMASGTLVNSGVKKDISEKDSINKVQCSPKDGKKGFWVCNEVKYNDGRKRSGCGCVYDTEPKDKLNLFNKMSEESSKIKEEEMYQKYASVVSEENEIRKQDDSKKSMTPSGDKKAKKAMSNQEKKPDINKHLMDDGNNGLKNDNLDTSNPININVSYNNNRPYTVNDFNNNDSDKNTEQVNKIPDINKYRFDDGNVKPPVKSNVQKSDTDNSGNYEMKMMRKILNEQNDPSPVLLESGYSEWKPLDN